MSNRICSGATSYAERTSTLTGRMYLNPRFSQANIISPEYNPGLSIIFGFSAMLTIFFLAERDTYSVVNKLLVGMTVNSRGGQSERVVTDTLAVFSSPRTADKCIRSGSTMHHPPTSPFRNTLYLASTPSSSRHRLWLNLPRTFCVCKPTTISKYSPGPAVPFLTSSIKHTQSL